MGTKFNVSTHNRKKRTQRHREENYEDKAEINVMQLYSKVHWGLLGTTQKHSVKRSIFPETSRRA